MIFLGLVSNDFAEFLLLLNLLFTKPLAQSYLLFEYFTHMFHFRLLFLFMLSLLFFVKFLAEFLDLAPFVITDIRRHVFNLAFFVGHWLAHEIVQLLYFLHVRASPALSLI